MATQENRHYRPDWWNESKDKIHTAVLPVIAALQKNNGDRMTEWIRNYRMYGDAAVSGISPTTYYRPDRRAVGKLTYNVIKSGIDTITARIAKNRPQPRFLTSGGTWRSWKKARLLNKFIQGVFYLVKAYTQGSDAFRKACVFGTAGLVVFERDDQPCVEPIFIDEILVDDLEACHGAPRQMHRKRPVDRRQLQERFPHAKEIIAQCDRVKPEGPSDAQADMVWVYESWHLPAKKPKKSATDEEVYKLGGVHTIVVEKGTLLREPWKKTYIPIVFMRWNKPLAGFFGGALASEGVGFQVSINRRLRQVDESAEWAVPKCFVHKSTSVSKAQMNADVGTFVEWEGPERPYVEAQRAIPQEVLMHLEQLKADFFNVIGISQLSAQSKKPAGLESGEALRVYNDFESERFSMAGREYEDFFLELARMLIDIAREIHARKKKSGESFIVTVPRRRATQQIDWDEIDLEEDAYVMQMFPTSALPNTPSGKLETLLDMNELGIVEDKNELRRLLDFPDIEAANALYDADSDLVEWQIEQMIEDGIDHQPEPFQDLGYAVKTVTAAYLLVLPMEDVPEENKELLREFIETATMMLAKSAPPPPAPQPQMGAQPGMPAPAAPPPMAMPPAASPTMLQ